MISRILATFLAAVTFLAACGENSTLSSSANASADAQNDSGVVGTNDTNNSMDAVSKVDVAEVQNTSDVAQCTTDNDCAWADALCVDGKCESWCHSCLPTETCLDNDGNGYGDSCKPECWNVADCDDGNICTDDACESGVCKHVNFDTNLGDVRSCELDGSYCTVDFCKTGGICSTSYVQEGKGCIQCNTSTECEQYSGGAWCSEDNKLSVEADWNKCSQGLCGYDKKVTPCQFGCNQIGGLCYPDPGLACNSETDCNDGDSCTVDGCYKGTCNHMPATQLWFDLAATNPPAQTITAGEVTMIKFTITTAGANVQLKALNFTLTGLVSVNDVKIVKLYQDSTMIGTATVQMTTTDYQVEINGNAGPLLQAGTTHEFKLAAEISPDASGTMAFSLSSEGAIDVSSGCDMVYPIGLPLQGHTMTVIK